MKCLLNITCIFYKHLVLLETKLGTFSLKVLHLGPFIQTEWQNGPGIIVVRHLPPTHFMSLPAPLSAPPGQKLIVWTWLESLQSFPPAFLASVLVRIQC